MSNSSDNVSGGRVGTVRTDMVRHGAAGVVTLDANATRNAINDEFRRDFSKVLAGWGRDADIYAVVVRSNLERVFSAGGDLLELAGLMRQDVALADASVAADYRLIWQLDCFTKPCIALIDGVVMGSAAGLVASGTHRVAGEGYRFVMPETAIGFFPDVGMAKTLAAMPGFAGVYLALTGQTIGRADSYAFGLVTHCIGARHFNTVTAALANADVVDPLLDELHEAPGSYALASVLETIERCFSATTVNDILARLDSEPGGNRDWALATAADLRTRSPFALKLTLAFVLRARSFDLRATLTHDYRLARSCLRHPDFAEGIRALLLDKDRRPKWQPERLDDVSDAMIDAAFDPVGGGDLELAPRASLQTQA